MKSKCLLCAQEATETQHVADYFNGSSSNVSADKLVISSLQLVVRAADKSSPGGVMTTLDNNYN